MSMSWQVKWTKAQEARCAGGDGGGQALFGVGIKGAEVGRWEQTGLMDAAKALFLSAFAQNLYRGMSARAAFEQAERGMTKEGLRRAGEMADPGREATTEAR